MTLGICDIIPKGTLSVSCIIRALFSPSNAGIATGQSVAFINSLRGILPSEYAFIFGTASDFVVYCYHY